MLLQSLHEYSLPGFRQLLHLRLQSVHAVPLYAEPEEQLYSHVPLFSTNPEVLQARHFVGFAGVVQLEQEESQLSHTFVVALKAVPAEHEHTPLTRATPEYAQEVQPYMVPGTEQVAQDSLQAAHTPAEFSAVPGRQPQLPFIANFVESLQVRQELLLAGE